MMFHNCDAVVSLSVAPRIPFHHILQPAVLCGGVQPLQPLQPFHHILQPAANAFFGGVQPWPSSRPWLARPLEIYCNLGFFMEHESFSRSWAQRSVRRSRRMIGGLCSAVKPVSIASDSDKQLKTKVARGDELVYQHLRT